MNYDALLSYAGQAVCPIATTYSGCKTRPMGVRFMEVVLRQDVGLKPDLHEEAVLRRSGFNPTTIDGGRDDFQLTINSTPIDTATGGMAILRPLLGSGLRAAYWTINKIDEIHKEIRLGSSRSSLLACMLPRGRIACGY
jgi:hypothetical protein